MGRRRQGRPEVGPTSIELSDPRLLHTESLAPTVVVDASRETFQFLEDVAMEVRFSDFFPALTIQMFEKMRLLALSDVFEDVTPEAKAKLVSPYAPDELRARDEYEQIIAAVRRAAAKLSGDETDQEFIRRVNPRVRRSLERVARSGTENERGRAAAELFERSMPKMPRSQTVDVKIVNLSEKAARLMIEAAKEMDEKP